MVGTMGSRCPISRFKRQCARVRGLPLLVRLTSTHQKKKPHGLPAALLLCWLVANGACARDCLCKHIACGHLFTRNRRHCGCQGPIPAHALPQTTTVTRWAISGRERSRWPSRQALWCGRRGDCCAICKQGRRWGKVSSRGWVPMCIRPPFDTYPHVRVK